MNKHGQQWASASYSQNGVSPSNTSRWQQTDASVLSTWNNNAALVQGHFVSMDADGFTNYFSAVDGAATRAISLCLGGVSSKIGAFTQPTSNISQTVASRHGFTPRGLLITSAGEVIQGSPVDHTVWALGATDGTNSRSSGIAERDNVSPTDAKSIWYNTQLALSLWPISQTFGLGSFSAWSNNDFTLSWTSATQATEHLYLLLGDSGINTFPAKVIT